MNNKGFIKGMGMVLVMFLGLTFYGIWRGYDIVRSSFYSLEYDDCVEVYLPEYSHNFGDFSFFVENCVKDIEKMNGVRKAVNGNPDIRIRVWIDKNAISKEDLQRYLDEVCSNKIKDNEQWENF